MTDAERGEPWTREQVLQALEILGLRAPEVEPPRRTWSSGARRTG